MRCKFCKRNAVIKLKYANLRLCEEHFNDYFIRRVKRTIKTYELISEGDNVLVAISGGKDSVSLAHALSILSEEISFKISLLHVNLGIVNYSEQCCRVVRRISKQIRAKLYVIDLSKVIGHPLVELSRITKIPHCSLCGLMRRYLINYFALAKGFTKISTGHLLEDLLKYILKSFVLQDIEQLSKLDIKNEGRGRLVTKIKPLAEISEMETEFYVRINDLPNVAMRCPFKPKYLMEDLLKSFWDSLEDRHPSIKLAFLRKFIKNKSMLKLSSPSISECKICGMPTNREICLFCRTVGRIRNVTEVSKSLEELE